MKLQFGILAMLLGLAGCRVTSPEKLQDVEVRARNNMLYLRNHTNSPVYYAVFSRELLRRSGGLRICPEPDCHENISPHQQVAVPYAQFLGEVKDDEAVLYWWHLVPNGDQEYQIDELHTLVIDLRVY